MRTQKARCLPDRRELCLAGLGAVLSAGLAMLRPSLLLAQAPEQPDGQIRVGDRWTFDTKDEITGLPIQTFTHVVTEISADQIIISASTKGGSGGRLAVYDRNWNVLENSGFRYKPHDGEGIEPPLTAGKQWRSEHETRNTRTGEGLKTSVAAKVVAQETITTPAGTFATFKIEYHRRPISAADPSRIREVENVGWYAPQVNHWARRTFLTRIQKRVVENRSEELIEYGRTTG
jgi:hypothetical protein